MSTTETAPVSVGDALGASGEPASFQWKGKTIKVGHPTQRTKARFEEFVAKVETESITILKGVIDDGTYHAMLADLGKQLRAREHRTGDGTLWRRYAVGDRVEQGYQLFVLALIQEHHPEFTEEEVRDALREVPELIDLSIARVVPGFFGWAGAQMRLPPEKIEQMIAVAVDAMRRRPPTATPRTASTPA